MVEKWGQQPATQDCCPGHNDGRQVARNLMLQVATHPVVFAAQKVYGSIRSNTGFALNLPRGSRILFWPSVQLEIFFIEVTEPILRAVGMEAFHDVRDEVLTFNHVTH